MDNLKKPKILFSGPLTPPITGQAMAFTHVFENYDGPKFIINTSTENGNTFLKVFQYIFALLKTVYYSTFYSYDKLYFTGSRSLAGGLRDVILVQLVSRLYPGVRIVNHLHGATLVPFLKQLPTLLQNIFVSSYRRIHINIVLLPSMALEIENFDAQIKTTSISNSYDNVLDNESAKFSNIKSDKEEIRIGYFSNLMFSKGIVDLLDAFLELSVKYPNISLHIAGDFFGDYIKSRNQIEEIVRPYFDNPKIHYLGVVQGVEKLHFLDGIDIFVLPSFHKGEAFPISIIEAMRCGNAIVTTNHNYLPEIVTPEVGLLSEPGNVIDLSQKIQFYIDRPVERIFMGKQNIEKAKMYFSPNYYLSEVYKTLLK